MKIYTVHAYRWGDREKHSYPVGVFDSLDLAEISAKAEEYERGGKYDCEIYEWELNCGRNRDFKTLKALWSLEKS